MFEWIRKLFRYRPSRFVTDDYESEQREQLQTLLREHPDVLKEMIRLPANEVLQAEKMLAKDFEARSLKEDKGGSSSSPISSP